METFRVKLHKTACVLLLIIKSSILVSQSFTGGLTGGFTTSQIDGDKHSGFRRIGAYGGFFVERNNNLKPFYHVIELSFSQKGSASMNRDFKFSIGYVDVVYLFLLHPKVIVPFLIPEPFRLKFGACVSAKVYENILLNDIKKTTNDFNRLDWQATVGIDYRLSHAMVVETRLSYSIVPNSNRYYNFVLFFATKWFLTKSNFWKSSVS